MTLLLHEHIEEVLARPLLEERLIVTPFLDRAKQIGPASIDLRLGTEFIEPPKRQGALDPVQQRLQGTGHLGADREERILVPLGGSIVLHPGHLILGCSLEFVRLPNDIGGQVLSRSSWGRVGLVVATAVNMQPGWTGMITLELANQGALPITLYPGLRVAQLVLWLGARPTEQAYDVQAGAKYATPLGPQSSRLSNERDELDRVRHVGSQLGVHPSPGPSSE
jgi:dCTP deaminase